MRFLKVGAVIFVAIIVTTLGIAASDSVVGGNTALLGMLTGSETEGPCPAGMVYIATAATFSCVDQYEASPALTCPVSSPQTPADTQQNLNTLECMSDSRASVKPWTYVGREQAAALCARGGKRLPTAAEWYQIAMATPDTPDGCNVGEMAVAKTGEHSSCVSALGVYDAVGNVWEWVSGDVREGLYDGVPLPDEGYVSQVSSDGMAVATEGRENEQFSADYFWSSPSGVFGMLRGGYYGNKTDAGVFAVQAKTAPTAATVAIGFRCVR